MSFARWLRGCTSTRFWRARRTSRTLLGWLACIGLSCTSWPAVAGTAELTWQAPSTNTDGTALANLAGYRIYSGCLQSGQYERPVLTSTAAARTITGLPDVGRCYFSVAAVNSAGVESARSSEAQKLMGMPALPGQASIAVSWSERPLVADYVDRFSRADGDLSGSTSSDGQFTWAEATAPGDILTVAGNRLVATNLTSDSLTIGVPAVETDTDDQYVEIDVVSRTRAASTALYVAVGLGCNGTLTNGYLLVAGVGADNSPGWALYRLSDFTPVFTGGDDTSAATKIGLRRKGNAFTLYTNSATIPIGSDSSQSSGAGNRFGFVGALASGGNANDVVYDNFAFGDVGISFVNNALGGTTTTTSFSITLPTTKAGDIIVLEFAHRGTGDGTIAGTYSGPAFSLKHSQLFASSAFSGKTYWSRATGNHSGETVTGSGLTNACAAIVTIYRGAKASGDPLSAATIIGEQNASGNETQAQITTTVDGAWVVLVVANSPDVAVSTQAATSPASLNERAEVLSTGGTDASIAHASAEKATAGATGSFTWAQTNGASGSWAYAIEPEPDPSAFVEDGEFAAATEFDATFVATAVKAAALSGGAAFGASFGAQAAAVAAISAAIEAGDTDAAVTATQAAIAAAIESDAQLAALRTAAMAIEAGLEAGESWAAIAAAEANLTAGATFAAAFDGESSGSESAAIEAATEASATFLGAVAAVALLQAGASVQAALAAQAACVAAVSAGAQIGASFVTLTGGESQFDASAQLAAAFTAVVTTVAALSGGAQVSTLFGATAQSLATIAAVVQFGSVFSAASSSDASVLGLAATVRSIGRSAVVQSMGQSASAGSLGRSAAVQPIGKSASVRSIGRRGTVH